MFTWICPQCGREVQPSLNECPSCNPAQAIPPAPPVQQIPQTVPVAPQPAAPAPAPTPAYVPSHAVPAQPVWQAPAAPQPAEASPYLTPQPGPQVAYPGYAYEEPKSGMNPVLVVALVTVGLLGVGYLAYTYLLPSSRAAQAAAESAKADAAVAANNQAHPYAKVVEVTGFRIQEDKRQQLTIQMVVVNHGGGNLEGLKMDVELLAKGTPVVEFPVAVKSIGPNEAANVTATAKTKLRAYELPDWQFLTPRVTITAP